jgi:hypothetical protein
MTPGAEPCPCGSVCVREPVVTKVNHVVYSSKCTEFCLGHDSILRSLLSCLGGGCDCNVHKKRDLVKKIRVEERCEQKCVLHPATAAAAAPAAIPIPAPTPVPPVAPAVPRRP